MELLDKLNSIIERLEKIQHLQNPDLNKLTMLIDNIEYFEMQKLDEEIDKIYNQIYHSGGANNSSDKFISMLEGMSIRISSLISSIRLKFGLDYLDPDEYNQFYSKPNKKKTTLKEDILNMMFDRDEDFNDDDDGIGGILSK